MRELETERLSLRYFRTADTQPIHQMIYSDPEVYQWWGGAYRTQEACLPMIAEAFQDLKLPRLVNGIAPENSRSVALAKRLGFREEPNLHPEDSTPVWILDNNVL